MSTESINVLMTHPMSEECMRQIRATSPKIILRDVSEWVAAERKGDFSFARQLDNLLAETEVIYGEWPPLNIIARAPKLKWIQNIRAGMNRFTDPALVQSSVVLINFPHGTPVGEFAIHLMLVLAKQASLSFQLKQAKQWGSFTPALLESKTVGILGLGNVGKKVAKVAKAFDMKVVVMEIKHLARARYVDVLLPPDRLPELLAESDFVVVTLPLTPETEKLIGEEALRTMKPTAYLINIARGPIVDEAALTRALDEHWIAGAGLDVFATEPLPADSRLWGLPNVVLSPHVAGKMVNYNEMATELLCENLRRYLSGLKLLHVVDMRRGY
ncbi:MAG: D-2-hydroxyacid dehydrogenase [Chloroflexota bacterium]|nr:D-2-hydroxyacid dehydrogenase [Chloroflexota bacterium]